MLFRPAQILDESLPRENTSENLYKPHCVLLASVQMRLAHTLTLLAADCSLPMGSKHEYISRALSACEEGIEALRGSASYDSCLAAELLFYQGMHNVRLQFGGERNDSILLSF